MDSRAADPDLHGRELGHGSNDGQKGMGLIMLILIGILPTTFAVDLTTPQASIQNWRRPRETISGQMDQLAPGVAMAGYQVRGGELSDYLKTTGKERTANYAAIGTKCREISERYRQADCSDLTPDQRRDAAQRSLPHVRGDEEAEQEQEVCHDPARRKPPSTLAGRMDKVTNSFRCG